MENNILKIKTMIGKKLHAIAFHARHDISELRLARFIYDGDYLDLFSSMISIGGWDEIGQILVIKKEGLFKNDSEIKYLVLHNFVIKSVNVYNFSVNPNYSVTNGIQFVDNERYLTLQAGASPGSLTINSNFINCNPKPEMYYDDYDRVEKIGL